MNTERSTFGSARRRSAHDPAESSELRVKPVSSSGSGGNLPPAAGYAAPALYFIGAMVESLGLGLVVGYRWVLVGGLLAVGGFVIATVANLRWSEPEQGISIVALLKNQIADRTRLATSERANTTTTTATAGHSTERR